MQNKILELAKSYKEELLRKNEMEYATNKPGIGEELIIIMLQSVDIKISKEVLLMSINQMGN